MAYIEFDSMRKLDLILIGRICLDFNPAYSDVVREEFKPLKKVHYFEMFVGGSPANIACGIAKHGMKAGFLGRISDDQFGDFAIDYFNSKGIDTSHIARCANGEKMGLAFTEALSPSQSGLLMYRNNAADLQLDPADVDIEYIKSAKAILVSGTALACSPSREAVLKAVMLAKQAGTKIIFDIDYRTYTWKSIDEVSIYYSLVAREADIIMGSREEFDLTERLLRPGMDDAQSAEYWHGMSAEILVIKHGMEGSAAYLKDGSSFRIKPFPVMARKGFGGGDGYAAGFLYGIYHGWKMSDCLEYGSAEASMMVHNNNCSESLPDIGQVAEFIRAEKAKYGEMVVRQ